MFLPFNPRCCYHSNFSWSNGTNVVIPNQYEGFPSNPSQPKPNCQGFSNGPRQPVPPPMAPNTQSQPPFDYSELDKYERRIRSDMERKLRENNERMIKAITEQFS